MVFIKSEESVAIANPNENYLSLLMGWFSVLVLDSDWDVDIMSRLKQYLSVMYT